MPPIPEPAITRRGLFVASGLVIAGSAELARAGDAAATGRPDRRAGSAPTVVTRAEWGADESLRDRLVNGYAPVRKLVIHHSAGPSWDPGAAVRRTYRSHTVRRGMGDIAYNFLIGRDGTVFEGRRARRYPPGAVHDGRDRRGRGVIGAHSLHTNAGSCGICVIGDFNRTRPTRAALVALIDVLAWQSALHRIDPLGDDVYIDLTGERRRFPNIAGHRDVRRTSCPGANLARLLPWIRTRVATRVGPFPTRASDMRRLAVVFHDAGRRGDSGEA